MIEKWITSLETAPMSVAGWIAGFIGVVWIRCFLEAFSSPNKSGYLTSDLPTLLHYTLFYAAVIFLTVVCVSIATGISSTKMMRSVIFMLPLMWIAPLIDLMQKGSHMTYIFAANAEILFADFITCFGGATLGLRIELGLLVLLLGGYVYLHTKRSSTAFVGMVVGYVVIFIAGSLPTLISFLLPTNGLFVSLQNSMLSHSFLHPSANYSVYRTLELLFDAGMAQSWYLILSIFGFAWLYRAQEDVVRALSHNLRPERIGHFMLMALLGGLIAFSAGSQISWTIFDFLTIAITGITILFTCIFAIISNDLVDESIDVISNIERPLVTGALTRKNMRDAGLVSGIMTILGALTLGSYATFWILVFTAAYYIYSVPPLRLKRVPLLASVFIGIATLVMMLLGFFLVSTNQALSAFPTSIALLVVVFMTLSANVRDLKDIEGDSSAGISTLPTLLGEKRARMTIGALMCIAYLFVPILIPISILWVPSSIAGVVSWGGLIQGKGERFVFPVYFMYLASVVLLLYFV
ncbi:MAG: UbiA family prenyltransferase [Candidatus Kaiserbacteria bacterium]|nr:UbiA family prenyltransferase [Candidatus Kaiserbacteria bacterium]